MTDKAKQKADASTMLAFLAFAFSAPRVPRSSTSRCYFGCKRLSQRQKRKRARRAA